MMPPTPQALSVFSCYAHEDAALRGQFEKHLTMLKRLEWVKTWSDLDISAGTERQQALDHHLQTANLLLLFVSPDFLASDYCYHVVMQEALRRHQAGVARVIPILLRPVEWKKTPLGILQALPRNGRPVTSWTNQDKAFKHIAEEIRVVVEQLRQPIVTVSSTPDHPFSKHLARDLTAQGISPWAVEANQELSTLKEQIRGAAAVVVIASPETEHARVLKETEDLLEEYQPPVMRVWVTDEGHNEGQTPLSQPDWIVVDPGQEQHALQDLCTTLQRIRFQGPGPSIHSAQEAPVMLQEPRNPYKGLAAFTATDVGDFFGRTALVDALVETVKTTLSLEKKEQRPARLLALVGASGSGKSSVVRAGLLPALQAGKATHSEQWIYLNVIAPNTHPLDELALALLDLFPEKSLTMLREDLEEDSARGLHLYATALARRTGAEQVVLVVDQFEEVFTLTKSERERQQFLDLLITACTKRDGPLIVVLTLRGDFYDRLMQYRKLYELVVKHLTPMLPMTVPDLRAVITEPAKLPDVQLTFEGNLVGDLLYEVKGQIGALPHLQFTLEQLVKRRKGHLLTEHAYQEMDGIRGALAKHAEECYETLPSDEHREIARALFLRVLDPGTTEQETTRRRAALTELMLANNEQYRLMQETKDAFVQARLLTTTADGRTGTTTIEVSHEALIREWPRLVDWLRTARDDIHLQQNISRAAATWERNTRSGDRLYQGTELKEAQAWAKRNQVSQQEQAFLKASVARQIRTLLTVIGVILLVVTSSGVAGWFYINRPPIPNYVTTTDEYATGSLRWAIENASSGSTITFAPNLKGQTFNLKNADIHITQQHITIQSPVTSHIAVQVMKASIFVDKSASATIIGITFRGSKAKEQLPLILNEGILMLTNSPVLGNTATSSSNAISLIGISGGGIFNEGTLTLTNSPVLNNTIYGDATGSYVYGGGIENSGTLKLINSPVSGNTASNSFGGDGYGGGIDNSGTLTLINSPVSGNKASGSGGDGSIGNAGYGGGIDNSGTLTLINSPVSGNKAFSSGRGDNSSAGSGGGINNSGTLTLTNSPVLNNTTSNSFGNGGIGGRDDSDWHVPGSGGGIDNNGTLTLTNSLVSGNNASGSGGGIFSSGSISPRMAHVTLVFCTIVNNSATDRHGIDIDNVDSVGSGNYSETSYAYLKASIVGGNNPQDIPIAGTITSSGYNILQRMSSVQFVGKPQSTDRSFDDLTHVFRLSPVLPNKDDPTQTYQLIPSTNNPAYNAIPKEDCTDAKKHPVLTDQRGMPRPGKKKQNCDSGAYESQVSP